MSAAAELPVLLCQVAEAAGLQAALDLRDACGGTEVYIPKRPGPDSPLTRAVGLEAARRIAAALGHGTLMVPTGDAATDALKRREIERLLRRGLSRQAIARDLRCHIRTVSRVAAELRAAPRRT